MGGRGGGRKIVITELLRPDKRLHSFGDSHMKSSRDDAGPLCPKHSHNGHGDPVAKGNHQIDNTQTTKADTHTHTLKMSFLVHLFLTYNIQFFL